MMVTMVPEIQKNFKNLRAFNMNGQINEMFQEKTRHERFDLTKSLVGCELQEGTSISTLIQKMNLYINRLEHLGIPFPQDL